MNLHQNVKYKLLTSFEEESLNEINQINELNNALRLLSKWKSILITNTYIENEGLKVFQGPFEGMKFLKKIL